MRRSQTKSAHGPTSAANGAPSAGPAPIATQAQKSTTWRTTTARSDRASRMSGASGSLGVTRYQWPRIIAAKTPPVAAEIDDELGQERHRPERAATPRQRPEKQRSDRPAAASVAPSPVWQWGRRDDGHTIRLHPATRTQEARESGRAWTGSQAGLTVIGELPSEAGKAPNPET